MRPIFSLLLACVAGTLGACSRDSVEDPLALEVSKLPAAFYRIPLKVTRPLDRRLPCGELDVRRELQWRVTYDKDSPEGQAALRVIRPYAEPGQLKQFIAQIEEVDDTDATCLPNVAELQDPRATPALRRALARLKNPMKRLFVLRALYACGDWNHANELVALMQARTHDTSAFRLLILYHPKEATHASLELINMADPARYGLDKNSSNSMVRLAIDALERLNHPDLNEIYTTYFKMWPAPLIAVKFGDRKTRQAEPLVRKALADASAGPFFDNFSSIMSYRYALAQLGDKDSMDWMLEKAKLYMNAPYVGDSAAREAWEKEIGQTSGDVGPFCDLLVKLGTPETLRAYADMLTVEAGNKVQSSISPRSLYLVRNDAVADVLEVYFNKHGELEKRRGLTDPKKVLALHPQNPRAMKMLKEFVPDRAERDDLLSLAKEFGAAGLDPQGTAAAQAER